MTQNLTVYGHILSPFCSIVYSTIDHLGLPHTEVTVDLSRNQQKEDWYLEINPKGKVPAIKDGDLCMPETLDICKYLVKSRELDTPFYPYKDAEKLVEFDEILEMAKTVEPTQNLGWFEYGRPSISNRKENQ